MGKRQIAAQETRCKLILASELLIRERGFENVSVEDIAKQAGVAKGSFYTYFKRKEDIVAEIANNKFVIAEERAKAAETVKGRIAAFLTESMEYIVDTGLNICQQWLKNVVEPEDAQGKDKLRYDTEVIRAALKDSVDRGELAPNTPVDALASEIAAFYYGVVAVWAITDGKSDPEKLISEYCEKSLTAVLDKYKK